MRLVCYSLSYHNCPVGLREKLSPDESMQQRFLSAFSGSAGVYEALVLSTCNRTEFYFHSAAQFDTEAYLDGLIASFLPGSHEIWSQYRRCFEGMEVVRHLFTVAAGLDSQMLGEDQIISQMKASYSRSVEAGTSRFLFHRLMHRAFGASKAVRSGTPHRAEGAISIALAAVELAKQKMPLKDSEVLLIGAGQNAALAAGHLAGWGVKDFTIASRTIESAMRLAQEIKTGNAVPMEQVVQELGRVDIVISSTSSPVPVITVDNSAYIISQRRKPLLIIDIAVPRDVEPEVGQLAGVCLYDIDRLNEQIEADKLPCANHLPEALSIIDAHVQQFSRWFDSLDASAIAGRINDRFMELAVRHARRYADNSGDAQRLEKFARSLVRKLLYGPISFIKDVAGECPGPDGLHAIDLVDRMFLYDRRSRQRQDKHRKHKANHSRQGRQEQTDEDTDGGDTGI